MLRPAPRKRRLKPCGGKSWPAGAGCALAGRQNAGHARGRPPEARRDARTVPDDRASMPWRQASRRHFGGPWASPLSSAGLDHPGGVVWTMREQHAPASAEEAPGHVIRAPAWHASMPCPDFRGACPALPWTAWPAYSLPSWLHGADASTMRDAPAPCPARPASPCGGAADGTLLPAEPPACPLRPLQASLLACLTPAPVLIPAHAPTQEAGVWRLPAGGCGGSRGSQHDAFPCWLCGQQGQAPQLLCSCPPTARRRRWLTFAPWPALRRPGRVPTPPTPHGIGTASPQDGARGHRGLRLRHRPPHGRGASPHGPAAGCP